MSTIVKPRLVLLQSATNKKQFFYLVFMDLPDDTETYPDPSDLNPNLSGTDLYYSTDKYELPADYIGNTITYLLQPFMILSEDESIPNIKTITFKAKTTKKKGDTGGLLAKQIWSEPTNLDITKRDTPGNYVCKGRCFVIQSFTNTSTYFVGTLVDYPLNEKIGTNTQLKNSNEVEIEKVSGNHPDKTFLAMGPGPASYDSSVTPPTATYAAIYVNGHNTHDEKGIFLYEGVDLYATAWPTEEGTEVSSIYNS